MNQAATSKATHERNDLLKTVIYGLLGFNLLVIFTFFSISSIDLLVSSFSGFLIATGRLLGLLAAFTALLQFLLMSRARWLESLFGLDTIARSHRFNGYAVLTLILLHPFTLILGYSYGTMVGFIEQYLSFLKTYDGVWLAAIAQILFIIVAVSSMYIARKHLKFESWYYVHLLVYAAIVLAFPHQISVGNTFTTNPLFQYYWVGLYTFVALNLIIWRLGMPMYNFFKYHFAVSKVAAETNDTHSLYISGNNLSRWDSRPGQYVLVRILIKGMWWQEHPFSLSYIPKDNTIRLTIKAVGDYTRLIPGVPIGARLIVSGPYGAFTHQQAITNKRLYIAGGVGITPLRSLIEESTLTNNDSVLIYGIRTRNDVIFDKELSTFIKQKKLHWHLVFSDKMTTGSEKGYVTAERVARLVPDFKQRDIYLCGPPVMMNSLIRGLTNLNFPAAQLHYEKFSFHAR